MISPAGGVVNNLSGYTYAEANPIRFSSRQFDAEKDSSSATPARED
jgi:hypothetical protein